MHALSFLLALAAPSSAAIPLVSTEPFSVGGAALHLAGAYYAMTFSREEAAEPARAIRERLARVDDALALLDRRAAEAPVDWDKVIDHFKFEHGVDPRRLALVRSELALATSSPEERAVERARLLAVRGGLLAASASIDGPEATARFADAAQKLSTPFFAEEENRVRVLGERLRALAGTVPPRDPTDFDASQILEMYRKDLLENPSHWPLAR